VTVEIDGERKEFESNWGSSRDTSPPVIKGFSFGMIEDALRKHGDELPPEVKQSLEAATKAMLKAHITVRKGDATPTVKPRDIGAKLDMILERLERVEKEVKSLEAKQEE
jgi:hypothetical protein